MRRERKRGWEGFANGEDGEDSECECFGVLIWVGDKAWNGGRVGNGIAAPHKS